MKRCLMYAGLVSAAVLALPGGSSVLAQGGARGSNHVTASLNGFQENPSIVTTENFSPIVAEGRVITGSVGALVAWKLP